ncbi:hypothetical protein NC652_003362 [Populus alba x Populus x berolinensis]|nr:hypothetical protein NC652_003362 [Populus alba x Populus x berolinensis]
MLQTMDRLHIVGKKNNQTCILCCSQNEIHDHLFFQCHYTRSIWEAISKQSGIYWPNIQ